MSQAPPLRADARRNRERVVAAAAAAFAADGLGVSVAEVARRAGVGTGTVSRHFPTKEELFAAVLRQGFEALTATADDLAARAEPGPAFFTFFTAVVSAGSSDRGLAERLAAAAGDPGTLEERVGADVLCDRLGELLHRAQQAGAVRADVALADVEALMVACMSRPDGLGAILATITDGLRPRGDTVAPCQSPPPPPPPPTRGPPG